MPNTEKTILALGDSYTIGEGVAAADRFPHCIMARLNATGIAFDAPTYLATTGWTTADLLEAIEAANLPNTYSFVTLLIGVNDQYQNLDKKGYAARFAELLQRAVTFAANRKDRVFVLSIPNYGATPFVAAARKEQVEKEIAEFNRINEEITKAAALSYTNITRLSDEAATNTGLLAADDLHYSGLMHDRWAALVAPKMLHALAQVG